jgi:hypothetical protein
MPQSTWAASPASGSTDYDSADRGTRQKVHRQSVELTVTQARLRGRVQASRTVAHACSRVLGLVLGGILGESIGLGPTIVLGVFGGLWSFLHGNLSIDTRHFASPGPTRGTSR